MIKIDQPYTVSDVIRRNLAKKNNTNNKIILERIEEYLVKEEIGYKENVSKEQVINLGKNTASLPEVSEDFKQKLYNRFNGGSGKGFYDELILLAENVCLYCGKISYDLTIDHYLPKSKYWQYSITPCNLVASCPNCNTKIKKDFIPEQQTQALIHPYLDSDIYFKSRWLYAKLHVDKNSPPVMNFYVDCPKNFPVRAVDRIKHHFDFFELGRHYSTFAVNEFSRVICMISGFCGKGLSFGEVKRIVVESSINEIDANDINNWKRVFYETINTSMTEDLYQKIKVKK